MRQSMRDALTGLGYQIIEADNGITALNSLADPQLAIDLIISDIIMPEMGGFELRRIAIEQRRVNIKTLLVTGYPLEDNEERLQQLEWMQKPFDIYELARRIRALLDEKT
jgi:two-component system chemotaxis response regulator CheY